MIIVKDAKYKDDYIIEVKFNDNKKGIVDLSSVVNDKKIKLFQKLKDKNKLSQDEILISQSILANKSNNEIRNRLNIPNNRFHSIRHNLIQKLTREYKKIYGAIASIIILILIGDKVLEKDKVIYKSGSEISSLKIPDINKPSSICSQTKQSKAKELLEKSYNIEDEQSIEYFNLLSSSLKECYSPEVATKLYIIKALTTPKEIDKIELFKEALYHISHSLNIEYRITKEIEIYRYLKEYYQGINRDDIINKIQIRQKELDAIQSKDL